MRRCTTLHYIRVIGGQFHDVLAGFGHVQKLAAILVHVGYPKMIVRCRTTSRTTSHDVEAHRTIFVQWSGDDFIYDLTKSQDFS